MKGKKFASGVHEKTAQRGLGNLGEDLATRYLNEKGYLIIDRNANSRLGEIDIVARLEKTIHFVEVKTASQHFSQFGKIPYFDPRENMTTKKIHKLNKTIEMFLKDKQIVSGWQLDVVLVYVDRNNKKCHIELLENISFN